MEFYSCVPMCNITYHMINAHMQEIKSQNSHNSDKVTFQTDEHKPMNTKKQLTAALPVTDNSRKRQDHK